MVSFKPSSLSLALEAERAKDQPLDKAVAMGLAWRDVVPFDIALLAPSQDRCAGERWAIIADDNVGSDHTFELRCIETGD